MQLLFHSEPTIACCFISSQLGNHFHIQLLFHSKPTINIFKDMRTNIPTGPSQKNTSLSMKRGGRATHRKFIKRLSTARPLLRLLAVGHLCIYIRIYAVIKTITNLMERRYLRLESHEHSETSVTNIPLRMVDRFYQ